MDDRRIDGVEHTFGDSGWRIEDAIVFYDHETDSLWDQWTATGIRGPNATVRLHRMAAEVLLWQDWLSAHPDSLVLSRNVVTP